MTFNSIEFALFFAIVFLAYWFFFQKEVRYRNLFLIAVSYFFYGWWDWRFLLLLMLTTAIDFYAGLAIDAASEAGKKKRWLLLSLSANLGALAIFKYCNFFVESFVAAFGFLGIEVSSLTLNIILPVGLSFYTFQSLSYTLDVYYGKIKPTKVLIDFAAFICFFPQLVAGPIERARYLLPQFSKKVTIDYAQLRSGLLLMAFGFLKKLVVADRLARYVDGTYADLDKMGGWPLAVGLLFFALQLYFDFSAYSDIAIGSARTLGFSLSRNFNRPYMAVTFSDFWRRWHISLSTWFRDYVYIPLGGDRTGQLRLIRNILIVFILSGLWHGPSWNFVIWGGVNALFLLVFDRFFSSQPSGPVRWVQTVFVVVMWTLSLVFFRAQSFGDAIKVFQNLFSTGTSTLYDQGLHAAEFRLIVRVCIVFFAYEILREKTSTLFDWFSSRHYLLRWGTYIALIMFIVMFGSYGVGLKASKFIYFQF